MGAQFKVLECLFMFVFVNSIFLEEQACDRNHAHSYGLWLCKHTGVGSIVSSSFSHCLAVH